MKSFRRDANQMGPFLNERMTIRTATDPLKRVFIPPFTASYCLNTVVFTLCCTFQIFPFAQATLSRGKSTKQLREGRTNTRLGGLLLTWKGNQRGVSVHHFQFWVGVTSRTVCFTTHLLRSGTSRRIKTWTSHFCEVHCQAGNTLL